VDLSDLNRVVKRYFIAESASILPNSYILYRFADIVRKNGQFSLRAAVNPHE
jgi:hypothetical protein